MDLYKPVLLNYLNFDTIINQSAILVDFRVDWCAPCKVQDSILEEIALEMNEKVLIGKVNVDDNRTIANKYGVTSIPTLILFHNGQKIRQLSGIQPKEKIIKLIGNDI